MIQLVSILIPAYNCEKTISSTIKSALNQTWKNIEVIIIDDGSTDQTFDIAKTFQSASVKVLKQDNQGAPTTRNNLFKLSQGKYIQWLDADDILDTDKITNQLKYNDNEKDPKELLTSSFGAFYYRTKKAVFKTNSLWQDLSPVEWIFNKFNDNVWMNPTAWLISRELTELAGPWDRRLSKSGDDDGEYICRIVKHCKKVKFVPNSKCYYRIGNFRSLNWQSSKALGSLLLSLKLSINHLIEIEDNEKIRKACLNHLKTWYPFFYPDGKESLKKINELADSLGGKLKPPKLKWKYLPFKYIFGYAIAKKVNNILPKIRIIITKYFDYINYRIENINKNN